MELNIPAIRIKKQAPVEVLQSQVLDDIDALLEEVDEEVLRQKKNQLLAEGKVEVTLTLDENELSKVELSNISNICKAS